MKRTVTACLVAIMAICVLHDVFAAALGAPAIILICAVAGLAIALLWVDGAADRDSGDAVSPEATQLRRPPA